MRRFICICLISLVCTSVSAQNIEYIKEIEKYREEQNAEFLNPEKSPLTPKQIKKFKGHEFFPINEKYRVSARFEPTPEAKPFPLMTSKGTTTMYKRLGILHFEMDGKAHSLEAYLEVKRFSMQSEQIYVFLPVMDATSGVSTYGAGRYLHFEGIPEGTDWVIDFNKLYNPYCAYSDKYNCPVVPIPNHISVAIEAGVKDH
jgi:hypothetical protein